MMMFQSEIIKLMLMMLAMKMIECAPEVNDDNDANLFKFKSFDERPKITQSANKNPLSQEYIDEINSLGTTWIAGRNFPEDTDKEYLQLISNGFIIDEQQQQWESLPLEVSDVLNNITLLYDNIPKQYDLRKKYPKCPTIGKINTQTKCGACWAVSASEVFSDCLCINSDGKINVEISALDTLSCGPGNGCEGGLPIQAFGWYQTDGVVTGGSYGTHETCKPYPFQPDSKEQHETPPCEKKCTEPSYRKSYDKDKHYATFSFALPYNADEKKIQQMILAYGSVAGGFMIYEDFFHYKSGVYMRHSNKSKGGHAIKIIGWGEEQVPGHNGLVPYWLVANSWGPEWGEQGFFKILRGHNECDIERYISVVLTKPINT